MIMKRIIRGGYFCTDIGTMLQHDRGTKIKEGKHFQATFLYDIPYENGHFNWKKSIGKVVSFVYDDINGDAIIIDKKDRNLVVEYNEENEVIPIENIIRTPSLGVFLKQQKKPVYEYIYNVGDIIKTENTEIEVLDRKKRNSDNSKIYLTRCLKCGSEKWRTERQLDVNISKYICPVCSNHKCKPGFNDITIMAPWMVPYFQGGEEEARQYTIKSGIKKIFVCPFCGKVAEKEKRICELYDHKLPCKCNLSWSYPERLIGAMLDQNNIRYLYNYSPDWACRKRYDFYLLDYPIIIEADGELGHGFYQPWKTYEQSEKEFEVDELKNKMATEHGFWLFRIIYLSDYKKEFIEQIKAELPEFLWKDTEWNKATIEAEANRKYAMCVDYDNSDKSTDALHIICEKYHCHIATLYKTLRYGDEMGWINYQPKTGKYHKKQKEEQQ